MIIISDYFESRLSDRTDLTLLSGESLASYSAECSREPSGSGVTWSSELTWLTELSRTSCAPVQQSRQQDGNDDKVTMNTFRCGVTQ